MDVTLGVKTQLKLKEAKQLFRNHTITKLIPTTSGIIDTTYITDNHVIKKYERDVDTKSDNKLLERLKKANLSVPVCCEQNQEWFLYERLKGSEPKNIQTFHIVALARFLREFHSLTFKHSKQKQLIEKNEINKLLNYVKYNFFAYYKRLQFLQKYKSNIDGLIHGDIFKDNTLFEEKKISVFDFIDSAYGNFAFDIAVCLVGFGVKRNHYYANLFLKIYNQKAPRKINKTELHFEMRVACGYYALKRINNYKNTKKAKELL